MHKIFNKNQHLFTVFAVFTANTSKEISYLVALQVEYLLFLTRRIFVSQCPTVDRTRVELVAPSQALSLLSSPLQPPCLSTAVHTCPSVSARVCSGGTQCRGLAERSDKFWILFPRAVELVLFQVQHYTINFLIYTRLYATLKGTSKSLRFSICNTSHFPTEMKKPSLAEAWAACLTVPHGPFETKILSFPLWNQFCTHGLVEKVTLLDWILMKIASKVLESDRRKKFHLYFLKQKWLYY